MRMRTRNHADYPVYVIQNIEIPMSDGVRLSAALYLPDAPNDGPFPAACRETNARMTSTR